MLKLIDYRNHIAALRYLLVAYSIPFFFISCQPQKKEEASQVVVLPDSLKSSVWDYTLDFEARAELLLEVLTVEEKIDQMMHDTPAIPRLGISAYNWWNEALHGVGRFGRATVFPQPIGMAASFDSELIYEVADAISIEGRAKYNEAQKLGNSNQYAGLTYWSPNVNIFRDPRWGRGMETWGEDPYLTSELGTAFAKGIQGKEGKYYRALACAKHFAVHSGPEADRHHFNALPSKKDFHETYLPAFEKLIKEGEVQGVMCAYNRLYDKACCGDSYLTNELLRNQWGFNGYVVTDCEAVRDFHKAHGVAGSKMEASVMAVKAGVNLNCGRSYSALKEAVNEGLITEEEINKSLKKLVITKLQLGLFDSPEIDPFSHLDASSIDQEKHKQLAYQAALKSMVLLKNNGVLPLKQDLKNLYLIGPLATDVDALLGNYYGLNDNMVTIMEGITSRVSMGTNLAYRKGFYLDRDNINKTDWAIGEARYSDVVVAVLGINNELEGEEGESIGSASKSDRVDIELPANQIDYLKLIRENEGRPLIVVMTGGSPLNISEVYDIADAVLWAWYPGQEGGNAAADILFGNASPSGKLPITFPRGVEQLPPYDDYSMEGRTYKYGTENPLFPFGFGLSYTKFDYEINLPDAEIMHPSDSIKIEVTVSNIGEYESDEVVQLYLSPTQKDKLPKYNLLHFERVRLKPKETIKLEIQLPASKVQYINEEGVAQFFNGKFALHVGGSLPSQRSKELGLDNAKTKELTVTINQNSNG